MPGPLFVWAALAAAQPQPAPALAAAQPQPAPALAAAQPQPAPVEADEIIVTGYSKPFKLTGKQLAAAQRIYARHRAAMAPGSRLLFEVRRKNPADARPLKLSLRSAESVVPIALDDESRFSLPPLSGRTWELVANRGSGSLKIYPLVMSPGTTPEDRRLGDMRLQCEVAWGAFVVPQLSFALRAMAGPVKVCRISNFGLYQNVERRIAGASVVNGAAVTPVALSKDGMSFRYPGYDKKLPNAARVRFRH